MSLIIGIAMAIGIFGFHIEPNVNWLIALGIFYVSDVLTDIKRTIKNKEEEDYEW